MNKLKGTTTNNTTGKMTSTAPLTTDEGLIPANMMTTQARYLNPPPKGCFNCGSPDHIKSECPRLLSRCTVCGKRGHLGKYCYYRTPSDERRNSISTATLNSNDGSSNRRPIMTTNEDNRRRLNKSNNEDRTMNNTNKKT
eukprot:scaffold9961_cov258-Ochromonas_danica.AAC.1